MTDRHAPLIRAAARRRLRRLRRSRWSRRGGARVADLQQEGAPQGRAGQPRDGLHAGRDRRREVQPGHEPARHASSRRSARTSTCSTVAEHNLQTRQQAAQGARREHLQVARRRHRRRPLPGRQLRRAGHAARHDGRASATATSTRSRPSPRTAATSRTGASSSRPTRRPPPSWSPSATPQKNEILALESRAREHDHGPQGRDQAAAGAGARCARKLAAQRLLGGPIPDVDPNSPGHPEIVAIAAALLRRALRVGRRQPRAASTAPASRCTATRRSASSMSHGATDQQRRAPRCRSATCGPATSSSSATPSFSHHVAIYVGGTTVHRGAAHRRRRPLRHAGPAATPGSAAASRPRLHRRRRRRVARIAAARAVPEGKLLPYSAEVETERQPTDHGDAT